MKALRNKEIDILVILLFLFLGFLLAWFLHGTFWGKPLISWSCFVVLPIVLYLSWRKRKPFKPIAMGTFVLGFVFSLIMDTLAEANGAWHVVDLVFPYRFPGGSSLDSILGFVTMTLLTLVVYEHFLDVRHDGKFKFISRRLATALIPSSCVVVTLFLCAAFAPHFLLVPYLYAIAGGAAIVPAIIIGFWKPYLYPRMAKIMPLFFLMYFVFEYLAVSFSWWTYPSQQFIGHVSILGVIFPFEELFFWMLFYAASLVVYYEEWIDDGK